MSKRDIIARIIKHWASSHHSGYQISAGTEDDDSISMTGAHLTWVLQKHSDVGINLLYLLDCIDLYVSNTDISRKNGGCICLKCKSFVYMTEPNQTNGTFICYSCRQNPFGG